MRKPTHKEIKIAGSISIANRILGKACREFIKESPLCHHKVKQLTNNLLSVVTPLINLTRSERLILEVEKINGETIDREDLTEDDNLNLSCVETFVDIIMNCNPTQLFNLSISLENIKKGERMYTENEVEYLKQKELANSL